MEKLSQARFNNLPITLHMLTSAAITDPDRRDEWSLLQGLMTDGLARSTTES